MNREERKKLMLETVHQRVYAAHGDQVRMVPETYVSVNKRATFVDEVYGEWTTWVSNVTNGHGHRARTVEKTAATCMERYGGTTPLGSPKVREKIEATNVVRYGSKYPWGNATVQEKNVATMLDRYGVANPQQVPEVRERTLATMVERYGVEYPYQSQEIMDRMEATNMERYGVANVLSLPEIREQIVQTNLERYGVENPMQNAEVLQRATDAMQKVTKIVHWKTGVLLSARASYEVAFIDWCNDNLIDFDWQVPFKTEVMTPKGRPSFYFVDAYIKSGRFVDTYIELKGTWNRKNGHVGKAKWEWFHEAHPNSRLWMKDELVEYGILGNKGYDDLTERAA